MQRDQGIGTYSRFLVPQQNWLAVNPAIFNEIVVGPGRFELPTSPLSGVRSNQLSYEPATGSIGYLFGI
jgi:hypothetical protein